MADCAASFGFTQVLGRYIMLFAVAVRGTTAELEAYAARVADGYRPPLKEQWPVDVRELIQVCGDCSRAKLQPSFQL